MPKIAHPFIEVNPFKIEETSFHLERKVVAESLFSIANEYVGVRAYFEEGYSKDGLIGTYFNGIYDYDKKDTPNSYKGIVKRSHFTLNNINFFKCMIMHNHHELDLSKSHFENFYRSLDFKTGLYIRRFDWLDQKTKIHVEFKRILDMEDYQKANQQITFTANKDCQLVVKLCLDPNVLQWQSTSFLHEVSRKQVDDMLLVAVETDKTRQKVVSITKVSEPGYVSLSEAVPCIKLTLNLKKDIPHVINKTIVNIIDKKGTKALSRLEEKAINKIKEYKDDNIEETIKHNEKFFNDFYDLADIEIDGDPINQQGIRYCLFQLAQTYHGLDGFNNLGAKGLTGEAYSGHAFWDSETYCLPFYLFTNQKASLDLLMFRYNTLEKARARARELDCDGACYPIATRNGEEACTLWQHASLQFQPTTAVFYAIMHYVNIYQDYEFLKNYGIEMISEIAKFLLSRGDYNQNKTKYSFYNVMGPDEFQMMVNHNTYTNYMAKQVFDYVINTYNEYQDIYNKFGINEYLVNKLATASSKMVILYNEKTKLYEQHDGFFDLPHIDINSIDEKEFPLYSHWSYDRIYRNDMIKQPDVLMMMFLYNNKFTQEEIKANYDYYEPRCVHESSLSTSIHSIIASQIGYDEAAYKFFNYSTRLDLDDYNNNTCEGIHLTSIAASWMNIVYGFGGLRSDGEILKIAPKLPKKWNKYSFKIKYRGSIIKITKTKDNLIIENNGNDVQMYIYDKLYKVKKQLIMEA